MMITRKIMEMSYKQQRSIMMRTGYATSVMAITNPVMAADDVPSPIGMAGEVISGGFMLQFFAGLAIVLLCIVGLAWLLKRAGGLQSSAHGALRVVDGIALSARERVVLVQVGKQQVLLGVAPGRVNALHVLDEPVDMTRDENSVTNNFSVRLRDAMGKEKRA